MISAKKYWIDFIQLFFPDICLTCSDKLVSQEKYICLNCLYGIPKTGFHKLNENKTAQIFWGRTQIEYATSYFFYRKGSRYQKLIHALKYKGLKELGEHLGRHFGNELADSDFANVDLIIPVPLHHKKLKIRGYNQSEWIAKGIGFALNKPTVTDCLYRKVFTSTQTRKSRYKRWENVEGIFDATNSEKLINKHILLTDDVITTGSTLEACANALLKIPGVKVSIATLGYADY